MRELYFLDNTIHTHNSPTDRQRCVFLGDLFYHASSMSRWSIPADFPHYFGYPLTLVFFSILVSSGWNLSPCWSLSAFRFEGKKCGCGYLVSHILRHCNNLSIQSWWSGNRVFPIKPCQSYQMKHRDYVSIESFRCLPLQNSDIDLCFRRHLTTIFVQKKKCQDKAAYIDIN